MNTLEKALTPGPFLLGERFSAADVYLGSQIGWGMMTKAIEARDTFRKYLATFADRPAFKRARAKNEEYMKQMPQPG